MGFFLDPLLILLYINTVVNRWRLPGMVTWCSKQSTTDFISKLVPHNQFGVNMTLLSTPFAVTAQSKIDVSSEISFQIVGACKKWQLN